MFQTVCCFLGLFFFLDIVIGLICVCILTCQRDSDSGKQLEENPTEDLLQLFVNLCIYSFLEIDTKLLIWQLWSLVRLCFYVEKIVVSISIAKKNIWQAQQVLTHEKLWLKEKCLKCTAKCCNVFWNKLFT